MMNRTAFLVFTIPMMLLTGMHVDASSHGMDGYSESGCTCHGANPGVDTSVTILGIPESFDHGSQYQLTISLDGGPNEAAQGHRGGFNLKASAGTFEPTDASTYITENGEITHEHSGANQRIWTVNWIAPTSEDPVLFTIAGNVVDGDHQPTDGDDWALASYVSNGTEVTIADRLSDSTGIIITVLLFVVPSIMLYRSKKK
ncbi:MAG: choice-of-anchor V domain-containing protein [Candidatus Thermoplasmatota archaeon]|nr:choice-of-anchor V domain-containing protein [Candidatus Thermoplasmatota archaeon]